MSREVALDLATPDDIMNAVETDGKKVDPWRAVAADLFNVRYEDVTLRMREAAKRRQYAAAYSRGRYG